MFDNFISGQQCDPMETDIRWAPPVGSIVQGAMAAGEPQEVADLHEAATRVITRLGQAPPTGRVDLFRSSPVFVAAAPTGLDLAIHGVVSHALDHAEGRAAVDVVAPPGATFAELRVHYTTKGVDADRLGNLVGFGLLLAEDQVGQFGGALATTVEAEQRVTLSVRVPNIAAAGTCQEREAPLAPFHESCLPVD